jgi:hypothetical protein
MLSDLLPATSERVRINTDPKINEQIRLKIIEDSTSFANKSRTEISARSKQLDREWDTERFLEANAATLATVSLALGFFWSPYLFILTALVGLFLLQHALQGWCPPLPIIRRLGYRTADEINEEKTALRILRGDFDHFGKNPRQFIQRKLH